MLSAVFGWHRLSLRLFFFFFCLFFRFGASAGCHAGSCDMASRREQRDLGKAAAGIWVEGENKVVITDFRILFVLLWLVARISYFFLCLMI